MTDPTLARVEFREADPAGIAFRRLTPARFQSGLRAALAALPADAAARTDGLLALLRLPDAEMVGRLFGLSPIPEPEVGRYAFHEGDLTIAAMARRGLAQAVVATRGMRFAADSPEFRDAIDSAGLAARVPHFGHYMRETFRLKSEEIARVVRGRLDAARVRRVVLTGAVGGSAIAVGAVRMLLARCGFEADLELWPHYPDPSRRLLPTDLAVIYAYSGNNEEQLVWMDPAEEAGAQVIGFAVGGRLEQMCRERGHPFVVIPGETFGLAQPREHFPVAIVLLLELLGRLGLARRRPAEGGGAFDMDEWRPRIEAVSRRLTDMAGAAYNVDLPSADSVAKQAALFLNWGTTDPDRIDNILATRDPVIWISHLLEPIGRRLENQFGECVEHPAPVKLTPEDMHNEQEAYVGQWMESLWDAAGALDVARPAANAVFLRFVAPRRRPEEIEGPIEGTDRLEARADKLFGDLLAGAPRLTFEIRDYGPQWPMLGELEAFLFCDLTRAFASIFRGVTPHYVHSMNYAKHFMATQPGTPGTTGTY